MAQPSKILMVGSSMPLAILMNPALATQPSMQGSIFARPYQNMKHSPQNDAKII